ncbi:MAG: diacylglycerol kinase [Treponema sp.]|nr:diacylglycerol kinase [Treponema sp.]
MKSKEVLNTFGEFTAGLCSRSLLAENRPLRWTIIANPKAGGFTINRRWKKHLFTLGKLTQQTRNNAVRADACPSQAGKTQGDVHGLVVTREPGHAGHIASLVMREALEQARCSNGKIPFNLFITAGGDGTSLEVLSSLYKESGNLGEDFAVLRLPMGTGNDGADAWELADALDRLIRPVKIDFRRALTLKTSTEGKGPFLAFNILSVGLDAFVTHMTNRMKGKLPGDSYKLWVDIAALFYDRVYTVGPMKIRALDENGTQIKALQEKVLLMAMGESGCRTYGSHKWILPDERNVCIMKQMPLFRKLALKGLFNSGGHIDKPEAVLFNAGCLEFSAEYPILAQMDGETVLLEPKDFPASIELSKPVIPVLKAVN